MSTTPAAPRPLPHPGSDALRLPDKLWTTRDVSEYLSVPVGTLYEWRRTGYGPPARRVGKHLRYRPADVIAWVDRLDDNPAA